MSNCKKSIYTAFTLAEILITLGIIGVVATMTIPTLARNIQDVQYKTAYKKAFSVATQVWLELVGENVLEPREGWVASQSNVDNFKAFMNKFNVIKKCDYTQLADCWAPNETSDVWYSLPFDYVADEACFIDKSGVTWCNTNLWGFMALDTNGFKKPNQYGVDRFILWELVKRDDSAAGGIPIFLVPNGDFTTYDATQCPSATKHPCYYSKWLYE